VPDRTPALFSRPQATELLIGSVLATLTSEKTRQAYAIALADFLSWTTERGEPLSKPLSASKSRGCSRNALIIQ